MWSAPAPGDLGLCKITTETSIAAGIRRIEAVCGLDAVKLTQEQARELDQAAGLLKGSRADLVTRLEKTLERQKRPGKGTGGPQGASGLGPGPGSHGPGASGGRRRRSWP